MDLKNNRLWCEGCTHHVDVVCQFLRGDECVERICELTTKEAVECISGSKSHREIQVEEEEV